MSWQAHLRPSLAELSVYDVPPAGREYARMHANECPEPWPAEAVDAIAATVRAVELERYPDTSGRKLRVLLGTRHGCDPGQIVLGNGSDEVIAFVLTALSGREGAVVVPSPTFIMYGHFARVLGMPVREVPVDAAFQLDEAAMRRALEGAAVCFLARPNNPTGALWDADVITRLVADHPSTVFVIDEAYGAYAPGSTLYRRGAPPNQVHMGTMSKVGAAAIRLGYCIADRELAHALDKIRHPYNVSATTLAIAELLLTELAAVEQQRIARALARRTELVATLERIPGARVHRSYANFVLTELPRPEDPARLAAHLRDRGVLIKDVSKTPRLERCVRVSLGTERDHERLAAALADWA